MLSSAAKHHDPLEAEFTSLSNRLQALRSEMQTFTSRMVTGLSGIEQRLDQIRLNFTRRDTDVEVSPESGSVIRPARKPLLKAEYTRFGRQLILPEIGLSGQLRLKDSAVLIVGAGGLGCPAAAYLARAGVGHIGIVDGDRVELSNLHRQILHTESQIGKLKVDSVVEALKSSNPDLQYTALREHLNPRNCLSIVSRFDVVLDCTDTPASRYLISDACVVLGKPLLSASAIRTEGQLMVLNYPPSAAGEPSGGPCYRCLFPRPPPADTVLSCGEGGILGPVVGVMGVMQALQTIKIITQRPDDPITRLPMLMFSGYDADGPFRTFRMRDRRKNCKACSTIASVTRETLASGSFDYQAFCGSRSAEQLLRDDERVSAFDHHSRKSKVLTIDVRERVQFDLCSLSPSINMPFSELTTWGTMQDVPQDVTRSLQGESDRDIHVICRLGNDSQVAVRHLQHLLQGQSLLKFNQIYDVKGGFRSWREEVDEDWPDY